MRLFPLPRCAAATLCLLLPLLALAADGTTGVRPGQWEVTTQAEMTNLGKGKLPTRTKTVCYSAEDVAKHTYAMPKLGRDCTVSNQQTQGAKSSYAVACSNGITGQAEVESAPERFTVQGTAKGLGMNARLTSVGRRIGDCPS